MWFYTTSHTRTHTETPPVLLAMAFFYLCLVVVLENDAFTCHRVSWTQGTDEKGVFDRGGARRGETKKPPGKKRRNSCARDDVHVMVISELPSCCKALACMCPDGADQPSLPGRMR